MVEAEIGLDVGNPKLSIRGAGFSKIRKIHSMINRSGDEGMLPIASYRLWVYGYDGTSSMRVVAKSTRPHTVSELRVRESVSHQATASYLEKFAEVKNGAQ